MTASQPPVRILVISGSTRRPSYTRALADAVSRLVVAQQAESLHWDLGERSLPIADPRFHRDPTQHSDDQVRELVTAAVACDAFILATPIYHNSYSGVLKNALDHLAIAQFQYKPVGLLSHGGNRSTQGVDHLRVVVRGLWGVATPTQVCTGSNDYRPSDDGTGFVLASEDIIGRVARFSRELVVFAAELRSLRKQLATY
jgi:NAD(P)H-dependent FMN reductase